MQCVVVCIISCGQFLLGLEEDVQLCFDPGLSLCVSESSTLSVGLHQLH